ncbi:anti-virulence regulator CigR family protein [Halomonas sp. CUBES01]|uniref:Anti-virulence regulator CigR family protein n=1 Tax=Vreelandella gomseomensis TaxID=370766 RepID=A0ABU1GCX7_9GAMM|nr:MULTISPECIES: anti-virulence regulator CigR family protein [Halomonas]MDR5874928.1 anti-virulence regulator CigR family protein [Halomonas gomseomensis]MEC4767266.1 anti-virulence regulator CigR family protein [Halomonas sp. CUBES01]
MHPFKIAVASAFSACLFSGVAAAQPDHAPAHGARDKQHQEPSQERQHRAYDDRDTRNYRDGDRPRIDERALNRLLREYGAPSAEPLPPGIERNLARGKPLPPGIAKRFDGRLADELPRYPGYEWQRVGSDVVLIDAATRVVVDILVDALR